jgi:hypothetical protein
MEMVARVMLRQELQQVQDRVIASKSMTPSNSPLERTNVFTAARRLPSAGVRRDAQVRLNVGGADNPYPRSCARAMAAGSEDDVVRSDAISRTGADVVMPRAGSRALSQALRTSRSKRAKRAR